MARRKKNRWAGLLFGPAVTLFALTALWKNETRFDFHRAAKDAPVIHSLDEASSGQQVSYTGAMDQGMTMQGHYVSAFSGYLMVRRSAEIYAWERDEDSDDGVTWTMRWMSSVESNSRNRGLRQELSSERFLPDTFEVGDLAVSPDMIEFVDSAETISPKQLDLTRAGLVPEDDYFFLRKGQSDRLGDERVSYTGIPIPATATYFGKFAAEQGIADTTHQRTGLIHSIIQDTGILHHIVAGERDVALATMKRYLRFLKWVIRGIGTVCVVIGLLILFSTIVSFLFHIPVLGRIAETGSWLLALAIGLPLAAATILVSYLIAHPFVLITLILLTVVGIYFLRRRGKQSQQALKLDLEKQYGHEIDEFEIKELEFLELAQLALSDSKLADDEDQFLRAWADRQRWDEDKFQAMLAKAKETAGTHETKSTDDLLTNLIRLALADGNVSRHEMRTIRRVGKKLGYDDYTLGELTRRAREQTS